MLQLLHHTCNMGAYLAARVDRKGAEHKHPSSSSWVYRRWRLGGCIMLGRRSLCGRFAARRSCRAVRYSKAGLGLDPVIIAAPLVMIPAPAHFPTEVARLIEIHLHTRTRHKNPQQSAFCFLVQYLYFADFVTRTILLGESSGRITLPTHQRSSLHTAA